MKTKNKKKVFAENVVFFSTKLGKDQNKKKAFAENCSVFSTKLGKHQKKKGLYHHLRPFSAGNL